MVEYFARTKKSKDDWETPDYFYNQLDEIFKFDLDPCANAKNTKCDLYFSKEDDGLSKHWAGHTVFVNPPFSNIAEWVKKCYEEGQRYGTTVVMIIPSRTDTKYWHDYVMRAKEIWFCKGRVNFLRDGVKPKAGATFPLCVVIFERIISNVWLEPYPKIRSFVHK